MGYTLEESCGFLKESYGKKLCTPNQIIQSVTLFHRQVYRYRYHRAKAELCLQEFRNARLSSLKDYLEAVMAECPHQLFKEGGRWQTR